MIQHNYFKYGSSGNITQHAYNVTETTYVPGLTTYLAFREEIEKTGTINYAELDNIENSPESGSYHYNQLNYSLGIDCSGLASRTANYNGVIYKNFNLTSKLGTRDFAGDTKQNNNWVHNQNGNYTYALFMATNTDKWILEQNSNNDIQKEKINNQRKYISHSVPGDILVLGGSHVVIIQDLNYSEGNNVINNYNQVEIIHATQGASTPQNGLFQVLKQDWSNLGNKKNEYQLRRMIIK